MFKVGTISRLELLDASPAVSVADLQISTENIHLKEIVNIVRSSNFDA